LNQIAESKEQIAKEEMPVLTLLRQGDRYMNSSTNYAVYAIFRVLPLQMPLIIWHVVGGNWGKLEQDRIHPLASLLCFSEVCSKNIKTFI